MRVIPAALFLLYISNLQANKQNPPEFQKTTPTQVTIDILKGGIAGGISMFPYAPFDYFQCMKTLGKPIEWNNPKAWLRGAPIQAISRAPTLAVQSAVFEFCKRTMQEHNDSEDLSAKQKTAAAMAAGAASGTVANITRPVTIHQQTTGDSLLKSIPQIWQIGPQSLTRALGTTIGREIMFSYIYRNFLHDMEEKVSHKTNNWVLAKAVSCVMSSVIIVTATQPSMVVINVLHDDKTRIKYKNGIDATIKIFKKDGVKGFVQGGGYRGVGIALGIGVLKKIEDSVESLAKWLQARATS